MLISLKKLDQQLFFLINSHHSIWWDRIMDCITYTWFWVPLYLGLIYLLAKFPKKELGPVLVTVAMLIALCDQFATSCIKPWVQRLRPCEDPQIRDLVHVVGHYTGLYGFISSHAANTFGLAMFLWLLLRKQERYIYILFGWAAGISYARVYGGVHYPSDVLVGAVSGLVWAWLVYRFTFA